MAERLRNRFGYSEWSGSIGDLGTLLPLAYALAINNGFPLERLFFLWGLVYVVTGWYFRVPVAVQPLKAMSVIALALGLAPWQLSTTAVLYGLIMLTLALTGLLAKIERFFSASIVRGIQLGVGLILVHKGVQFALGDSLFVHVDWSHPLLQATAAGVLLLILAYLQWGRGVQIALPLLLASVAASYLAGVRPAGLTENAQVMAPSLPRLEFAPSALVLLIIPQLPMTLGNAVFAASDACHTFWPERARRVSPRSLALSIGLSDLLIGLLGGFPICHGSGGIGAHARFGGRTGGTTIILGFMLIAVALAPPLRRAIFLVPVPLLGVLLVLAGLGMAQLIARLDGAYRIGVAVLVGLVSFGTRNLAIALVCGIVAEKTLDRVALLVSQRRNGTHYAGRQRQA